MLLGVVATSLVIVRRKLRYEWWYAVHLLAYAGIALSWFHEIPTGNELVLDTAAADYWRALYLATLAILVVFRLVAAARAAGPLPTAGRGGDRRGRRRRLPADHRPPTRPAARRARAVLPLALPRPPARLVGASVLALRRARRRVAADHRQGARRPQRAASASVRPGTRVLAEGPFGVFTEAAHAGAARRCC